MAFLIMKTFKKKKSATDEEKKKAKEWLEEKGLDTSM